MSAILEISTVIVTQLTAAFQNTVLATVPRVLRRSAQRVVSQDRTHRIAHEADLPSKAFALVALDELVIHLIGAHHDARYRILII